MAGESSLGLGSRARVQVGRGLGRLAACSCCWAAATATPHSSGGCGQCRVRCPVLWFAAEGEARLRQQQELYESVRSERNSASRSLVEVQVGGWRADGRPGGQGGGARGRVQGDG